MIKKADFLRLQNGSDIRGIVTEGVKGQHVNLTGEAVFCISRAFIRWLSEKLHKSPDEIRVGVGYDPRISSPVLKKYVLKGIISEGVFAYDCGLSSTPSMFMSLTFSETHFDGSIMITASHLPFNRNGLKFFTRKGGLEKEDITALLENAAECGSGEDAAKPGMSEEYISSVKKIDLISIYSKGLREKICAGVSAVKEENALSGLKIVVDAGNGAGGFFVEKVLNPLGAETRGSQFLEPDGMFPNHIPNPENPEAMESVKKATVLNHADLGIIFDTDVDRMSAVLESGKEINRDLIIGLMAAILAKDHPNTTIVTDSVTSDNLTDFLENTLHMKHHRFRRGYKNVINEAIRLNKAGIDTPLAIETSGHGALRENYFLDDGAYMAVKLIVAVANAKKEGKNIASLIDGFKEAYDAREYRMNIFGDDFKTYGENVLKEFESRARNRGITVVPDSCEGVRLTFKENDIQGWLLLRVSLHDPLMPMNLEGNRGGDCEKILSIAKELLMGFDRLDTSILDS